MARAPHSEQAPAVQKLRVRFARRGRLRFTSHRDFQRAFERALRRARVPVAYSQGFTPHPKVSYAGAAPMGAASEAEYLEVSVTEVCDPLAVAAALDAALPPGLDIVKVVEAGSGSLADRLQASAWEVRLPGVEPGATAAAVKAFLARPIVDVERMTKNGMRTLEVRGAVVRLEMVIDHAERTDVDDATQPHADHRAESVLRMVVCHQTPTVRPDDVLVGLRRVGGLPEGRPPLATRLAQGPVDAATGTVGDPLSTLH